MSTLNAPSPTLLIGCGVIGSVYGSQVAIAGRTVWVLAHGQREQEAVRYGIQLTNVGNNMRQIARVELAETVGEREYDLVLVSVQAGQLASTFPALQLLKGSPHIIFFGNNPACHAAIPSDLPGSHELAFPGVGGILRKSVVEYGHISGQPTEFETNSSSASKKFQAILEAHHFRIQRTANMDGWLQYHAVLISCISAALLRTGVNSAKLGNDPQLLDLMCRAIEEGFQLLLARHIQGLPQNLKILHSMFLRPVARQYWGTLMRSPKGELFFAGHVRHSTAEVHALAQWTLEHVVRSYAGATHLKKLLLAL